MPAWLIKSEPGVFSIDDLAQAPKKTTAWDGVRNYQARNNLRAMKRGELCFYYHSNAEPSAIVGIAEVVREAYPDPDPLWSLVDVRFVKKFLQPLPLESVKKDPALKNMALVAHSRLSVQPVTPAQWSRVLELLGERP